MSCRNTCVSQSIRTEPSMLQGSSFANIQYPLTTGEVGSTLICKCHLISMRDRESIPQPLVTMCFVSREMTTTHLCQIIIVCLSASEPALAFISCIQPTYKSRHSSDYYISRASEREDRDALFGLSDKLQSLNLSFHSNNTNTALFSHIYLNIIAGCC